MDVFIKTIHHTLAESTTFSLLAPKRECSIFGPGMMKNRIRNMGIKRATPEHMFATRAEIYTCSGLANSLPPLLCNILLKKKMNHIFRNCKNAGKKYYNRKKKQNNDFKLYEKCIKTVILVMSVKHTFMMKYTIE